MAPSLSVDKIHVDKYVKAAHAPKESEHYSYRIVLSDSTTDGVDLALTYRKPFGVIFQREKKEIMIGPSPCFRVIGSDLKSL